jgi:cyclase
MSRRFLLMFTFVVVAASAFLAHPGEAQPETFKEITKGVWFRQGDVEKLGHCNNAVIELHDGLLVVDANFPSGARLLMSDIQKVSKKPVKWVFDTHHHGDHAYANAVWTAAGAQTLAFSGVAEEMKRREPKAWLETAKERKDVAELNRKTAEPPQKTFDKSPHVIDDPLRRVEFHFFGWAHTRGDGFVYLPKEKILCTGDAVTNGPYNYLGDGNVGNWPKVIEQVQKLDVATVIPGHGPVSGKEVLEGEKQFMLEMHKGVSAEIKAGKKPEDMAKAIKLPEALKKWQGNGFAGQIRAVYQEITAKKPAGELPH